MAYAPIDINASGVNQIVPGVTGKVIRVIAYLFVAAGSVTAQWKSGATAKSGAMSMILGTPISADAAGMVVAGREAWLETASGEDLNLVLGGAIQVSGHLVYEYRML